MGHTAEEYCRSCTDTIHVVQGTWKMHILCAIRFGRVRLGQLVPELPTALKKVLTENLRELEVAGLVIRRNFGGSVPHVEYDFKDGMRPALHAMLDHLADFGGALSLPPAKPARSVSREDLRRAK